MRRTDGISGLCCGWIGSGRHTQRLEVRMRGGRRVLLHPQLGPICSGNKLAHAMARRKADMARLSDQGGRFPPLEDVSTV